MKENYLLTELIKGARCNDSAIESIDSIKITSVTADSRQVKEGTLFAAIRGFKKDGHDYINEVIKKGASVVLVNDDFDESKTLLNNGKNILFLKCRDSRESFGIIASNYFGNPSQKLKLIGITGTNGKTTTAYLLNSIFESGGINSGMIGTIIYKIANEEFPSSLTTPDAFVLNRFLRQMVDAGSTHSVMEVSSHAIHLKRISGCRFNIGIFTNLSSEHLDFHKTMEDYYKCKKSFFDSFERSESAKAVVNIDDEWGSRLARELGERVVSYSIDKPEASVKLSSVESSKSGIRGNVSTKTGVVEFSSSLSGYFNFYNILAAVAASVELGISPEIIGKGIDSLQEVPGRFQRIENNRGFDIIIDYAHTPDALEKLLTEAKKLCRGRLVTVFGCGGNRDTAKRPLMGSIAASLSEKIIVTSDNPRNEDPDAIISQILKGIGEALTGNVEVIPDRKTAIKYAIGSACSEDTVIIAGKGHEDYQIVGDKILRHDDREEVLKILQEVGNGN